MIQSLEKQPSIHTEDATYSARYIYIEKEKKCTSHCKLTLDGKASYTLLSMAMPF